MGSLNRRFNEWAESLPTPAYVAVIAVLTAIVIAVITLIIWGEPDPVTMVFGGIGAGVGAAYVRHRDGD